MPLAFECGSSGPGPQQPPWALSGWQKHSLRLPPDPPILEGPSPFASILLIPLPPMPLGPKVPEGASEGGGTGPGAQQASRGPRGQGKW